MRIEDEIDGRFRNEYHKGMINLVFTTNHLNYSFVRFLKSYGLTSQQYNLLRVLRGFGPKPRSIDFLRKRMLDKKPDMSRVVDKLHKKGLVNRKENNTDRRLKDVIITKKGLELLAQMDDCEKQVDTLLKNLTPEEVDELNRLLDKIRG
ncbi:MAG: MarR family transcriptional regulator [Chlorobi bacterium]|nr:MarR family transcriptional regulator [Chlorobiota bacterium]